VVKAFVRAALAGADAATAKEVESSVAGVRAEKVKKETAAKAAAAKKGKGKSLNVGRSGGAAGLDDFRYDDLGAPEDDLDFM
jgi:translation initiation factor 3 subunit J